jgi:hypothetical protein
MSGGHVHIYDLMTGMMHDMMMVQGHVEQHVIHLSAVGAQHRHDAITTHAVHSSSILSPTSSSHQVINSQ